MGRAVRRGAPPARMRVVSREPDRRRWCQNPPTLAPHIGRAAAPPAYGADAPVHAAAASAYNAAMTNRDLGAAVIAGGILFGACSDDGGTPSSSSTDITAEATTADTTQDATTEAPPPTTGDPPPSGTGTDTSATGPTTTTAPSTITDTSTGDPATTDDPPATDPDTGSTADTGSSSGSSTTGPSCGVCDQPNQQCIDDVCVTSCQGQDPDPCGPAQVCDVISGECKDPADACVLAGPSAACDLTSCGPGTVCDGEGACVAIAPCADVACASDGACWGVDCACDRGLTCTDPPIDALNGPFSVEIGGIDFADDCQAWMVTLRSGPDYVRRLKPDGEVTQWTGVANLNMGEVKVLRQLTVPELTAPFPWTSEAPPPSATEGLGEVAITYTCCPTCGCQANPPQGVARLVEEDLANPLPIVIVATATQGSGPFASNAADAGPHGLTWGVDRVLYVGNSSANGVFNSADLDTGTQTDEAMFDDRVSAAAPVSPAHLVIGVIGGDVFRFNVKTKQIEFVVDLGADITGFSHDKFSGLVYAGLSTLEIVSFDPFTGEVASFGMMPGKGRVAVSPSGTLYYTPVKYLANFPITPYDLPDSL
jgi:hypothetical protein